MERDERIRRLKQRRDGRIADHAGGTGGRARQADGRESDAQAVGEREPEMETKASELTSEISWIRKDAKVKLERERSENRSLEKSIKTLRRMLDEREEKIRALTDEIRNTEDRVSACRWWLGFLILETALVTYFAEPLSRLPIPLWGVHAGALIGWIVFGIFLRRNQGK